MTSLIVAPIITLADPRVSIASTNCEALSKQPSIHSYTLFVRFGTEFSSVFLPYGDRWRLHRRLFHQAFNMNAAMTFRPTQMKKAHELIINLMNTPDDFMTHLET